MVFPATPLDVLVEMAIGEDPAAEPSTWSWTDITDYALTRDGIQIVRGRQDRFSTAGPSSLSLTVNNTGGRFVVRNPSGAYYGSLRRNVPIRVSIDGVPRFTGFVDKLPVSWDVSGKDPHVKLQAFGALKRLSRPAATVTSSPRAYIPTTAPRAYWPLEDGELVSEGQPAVGTRTMAPWTGTHPSGAVITRAKWGTGSLGPWLPPTFGFGSSSGYTVLVGRVDGMLATEQVVSFMYAGSSGSGNVILDVNPGYIDGTTSWPQVTVSPTDRELRATFNAEPEVIAEIPDLFDGLGHVVHMVMVQASTKVRWIIYVDGVKAQDSTTTGAMTLPVTKSVGLVSHPDGGGVVGHVAVWDAQPSPSTLAAAGLGYPGEVAGRRISRLCFEQDIPFIAAPGDDILDQFIRLGDTQVMGPQPYAALLPCIAEAEDVDGGTLSEATTGELEYLTGRMRYNRAVDLALDYDDGHIAPPFEPADDDADIRNDVTASRTGGGSYRYTDDVHIAAEGRYDEAPNLNAQTDGQLPDLASWRVHLGTVPELRYPQLSLRLHGNPALIADWLVCGLSSRVTIENPPPELPPDLIDQHIVGYTERFDQFSWEVSANLAPASPFTVGIWEDSVLGRVDTDGSRLASAINNSVTSVSVETTAGQVWIRTATHAAEFPFDVRVGGEVMTVTAIVNSTSPQTFTVTRGVNGIATSHADEAPVSLAHPLIVAL